MPGGLTNPIAGYLAFSGIKLAGYSLAAWQLNRKYPEARRSFLVVGVTRTAIGMVFGVALAFLFWPLIVFGGWLGLAADVLLLIPVRLLEWWIIILFFYDRHTQTKAKDWRYACLGTVWSFTLDIPAVIGLIATAGFWIC